MTKDEDEMERMVAIEQKMGRLPSQHERIRRPNAGDIPPMPAAPVVHEPVSPAEPEDQSHEEPLPDTPPPEDDEDEIMEDCAPQDFANAEDDDEERLSYRQEAFGAEMEARTVVVKRLQILRVLHNHLRARSSAHHV